MDAVLAVTGKEKGKMVVDEDDVMVKKQRGQSMDDAELIRGIVIDKSRVHEGMPRKVTKAKVALIAAPMEITKTQVKAKIKISTAEQVAAFNAQEQDALKQLAEYIIRSGATVLLCQKGIADPVQFHLAKAGILAVEDVPESDMQNAAKALSANLIQKAENLTAKDLGHANLVEQDHDIDLIRISGCKNPRAITILLRGSSDYLLDELERAVNDGKRVVMDASMKSSTASGFTCTYTHVNIMVSDFLVKLSHPVKSPNSFFNLV